MAYYLNQFHCIGNLVAAPELKSAGQNKVCKFRIAVNNPHNEKALFFYIDVWGREGEKCMMLKKGAQVFISNASIIPKQYTKTSSQGEELTCTTFTVNVDGYCGKIQFGPKVEIENSEKTSTSKNYKSKKNKKEKVEEEISDSPSDTVINSEPDEEHDSFAEEFEF
jgi:single-stranded DNA-binding protein